ncbi:DfsB family protein [Parabacteroides sp. 52]|uniref:ClbS/DfsB family four-helix bundle protein n=1 Tax=unclassified Parabacteroides TaxID=2649774 RepID=UPI0013D4A2DD|nr:MULTISPECIES: ClbS/DfsB family four-helix bundle protein [unclassified Parabacteroides]NDV56049.1 DfsB family protein [Parabacteroides sp. 52]
MARPTNKQDLILAANSQFEKLWKLIDSMPEEKRLDTFSFEDRDRNLRDVLVHLYEWHRLLLHWARANRSGNAVSFLPDPYNWKTYPQMNVEFWKKHQITPLDEAVVFLKESHADVMELIDSFTDEELFTKKYFSWTGTTHLGSYCVSATSSHYDWAMKKIKLHIKS